MAFGSQFPLLFIRLADLDVSILIILIIIFIFVIIPFISLVKSAITRLIIGSLVIVLICTAPLVAATIPIANAQIQTSLNYSLAPPFTIVFETKVTDESNKWWELDYDRCKLKIFINGSQWNIDNWGNNMPWDVEWDDNVFGQAYEVIIGASSVSPGMHCTFKLDHTGSKLYLDLVSYDDYTFILMPIWSSDSSGLVYNIDITVELSSGNSEWYLVEILSTGESLGGTLDPWAHFFKVTRDTWNTLKSMLPAGAKDFLDLAENAFTLMLRFLIDVGTFILSFGFTFYGLAWVYKLIETLTKLDPSILIDFIDTQVHIIIAIYNFLAGLIRTIISLIKWW